MPRQPGPWPRKQKNGGVIYYAYVGSKQISLRTADEGEAWEKYRALQQGQQPIGPVKVAALVERYQDSIRDRVKGKTFAGYSDYLDHLTAECGLCNAAAFTKGLLEKASRKDGWGQTTRSRFITVVKQVFRWAESENLLSRNPLKGFKAPVTKSRGAKAVIKDDDYETLIMFAEVRNTDFADYLKILWETGARPSEIAGLKPLHIDFEKRLVTLTEHKTEAKGKTRRILLSDTAFEILKRRSAAVPVPNTYLWKNTHGERLTTPQLNRRLRRLMARAGVFSASLYGFRHSFATRMLKNDVSETKVAALLGHASTAILHKHYSHILDDTDELLAALKAGNS